MRVNVSTLPDLSEIRHLFDLDESNTLCWVARPGHRGWHRATDGPIMRVEGAALPTRYVAFALVWGRYPQFTLRPCPGLAERPASNRPLDWVEVPTEAEAPSAHTPFEYHVRVDGQDRMVLGVVPRKMKDAPIEYRYVRRKMFASQGGLNLTDPAGYQWRDQVILELNDMRENIKGGWKPDRDLRGEPASSTPVRKLRAPAAALLDSFLPPCGGPGDSQVSLDKDPLEAWYLSVDDGYDQEPLSIEQPCTLPPLPFHGLDPLKLPAPITTPVERLDMTSYKAIERLLGVACRLRNEFNGKYRGKAGALVKLSFGPLDGCWRAASRTQTEDGDWKVDIRESQPAALDAARGHGWLMEVEEVVGRTVAQSATAVRRDLLKRWRARPPSPAAMKACRAAWTDSPAPAIGGDLRKAPAASQAVLRLPGAQADSPMVNLPLVLDNLMDPLNPLEQWTPPNRGGGATTGVAVLVERTTHGFTLSLRARPRGTEEPYRVLNTFRIPIRITAKKLNEMGRRRIWTGNAANREKLLALAPAITTAIKARLQQEKDYYNQPTQPKPQ